MHVYFSSPAEGFWGAYRRQWSVIRLGRRLCRQHFKTMSLKPLGRLKRNGMWNLLGVGEQKFVRKVWITWPSWPQRPYMVNSENIFLRNRAANDYETWYLTLMTRVLKSVFKWYPLIDFQLFYSKVKLVHLGLCMEKGKTVDFFFWFCCSLWHQSWFICVVLRFHGPFNSIGSCRARSVYLHIFLPGRLSPLSG